MFMKRSLLLGVISMSPQRFLSGLLPALLLASPVFADETNKEEVTDIPESEKIHWGFGVRAGTRAVPSVGLDIIYDIHPSLKETLGTSFGLEVIHRKGVVDLKLGISFEDYSGSEGEGDQFLKNNQGVDELEFIQNSLQLISFDLNVVGSSKITNWWHLLYGAGIGVSIVRGDIVRTDSFAPDPADPNTRRPCNGVGDPAITCFDQNFSERNDPEGSLPPVVPALNMLLGMRFDLSKNVAFRVEGGLRTISVYTGAGFDFVF
jgi:hypothetical protein